MTLNEAITTLLRHERQAACTLNLVPSESAMSPLAKLPFLLDLSGRYFFNVGDVPGEWSFRGAQSAARLETALAVPLLRELTGARYVNLRPLSGLNAMTVVLSALSGGPGNSILTMAEAQGGHYATASLARRLGLRVAYLTGPDPHTLDLDQVAQLLCRERPALVYMDQSNCLFPTDVRAVVEVVRRVHPQALVHVDVSHWLGLVLGRVLRNPLDDGADSIGGSTHKSFPGPQKGIIATHRADVADRVARAQFELISSHHFAASVSLGLSLLEFRDCGGQRYASQIVANANRLAGALVERGLDVVRTESGYTGGHQLWVRTAALGMSAMAASDALYAAGLRVNAFRDLPCLPEPLLRLGVNEPTWHGLVEEDMDELAEICALAIFGPCLPSSLAGRVGELRSRYRRPFAFPMTPQLHQQLLDLLQMTLTGRAGPELAAWGSLSDCS
jgi:glycine/serine hydroxymethyltransferase